MQQRSLNSGPMQSIRDQLKLRLFEPNKPKIQATQEVMDNCPTPEIQSANSSGQMQMTPIKRPGRRQAKHKYTSGFQYDWVEGDLVGINCIFRLTGEGGHAVVKRCHRRSENKQQAQSPSRKREYAVKIFRTGDPEIINTIKAGFNNNRLLNDSKHIAKAYDLYIDENTEQSHLIMEYCDFPSLEFLLEKESVSFNTSKRIFAELAQAIDFVHSKGIAHRDLKPDNIMVKVMLDQVDLKLIDFGVSKKFLQKTKNFCKFRDMWTRTGTIFYQAPEIFEGGGYDSQVDMWALGVILFQMLCGKLPYQAETIMDTISLISEQTEHYENDENFQILNNLQQDLLRRLLKKDPAKRLTAKELLLHPWLVVQPQQIMQCLDDLQLNVQRISYSVNLAHSSQLPQLVNTMSVHPLDKMINEESDEDEEKTTKWDITDHIHYTKKDTYLKNFQDICDIQQSQELGYSYTLHSSGSAVGDSPISQSRIAQQIENMMKDYKEYGEDRSNSVDMNPLIMRTSQTQKDQ